MVFLLFHTAVISILWVKDEADLWFVCVILSWVSLDSLKCIRWVLVQNELTHISLIKRLHN